MDQALLIQKIEFLEAELEESTKREESLRSVNNSLIKLLDSPNTLPLKVQFTQDHTLRELQEANHQLIRDMHALKKRYQLSQTELETQNRSLALQAKELTFALKRREAGKNEWAEASLSENRPVFQELQSPNEYLKMQVLRLEARTQDYERTVQALRDEFEETSRQRDHATRELDKTRSLVTQLKLEAQFAEQRHEDAERGLKNEVQFLLRTLTNSATQSLAASRRTSFDLSNASEF